MMLIHGGFQLIDKLNMISVGKRCLSIGSLYLLTLDLDTEELSRI